MSELDEGQQAIISKVRKLIALASNNPNEEEAARAMTKANEYLAAYNLDLAMVGEHGEKDARREEQRLKGGAYLYQRWVWEAVAELNFCFYWPDRRWVHYKVRRKNFDGSPGFRDWPRYQWHHFIVGRTVNVTLTRSMAEYLEQVIERLTRDRLRNSEGVVPNTELFSRWAISLRSGMAHRVVEKLHERRNEKLKEENEAAARAARAGTSTSTALTISSYSKSELDANLDTVFGEGYSAKKNEERAREAAARREAEEEWTRYATEHPEEARKKEAEERAKREKQRQRESVSNMRSFKKKFDQSAFYAGYDIGDGISIDQQMEARDTKRIAS